MSYPMRYALLGAALFSVQAAAVDFSFVAGTPTPGAFGNSYTQTLDGLTATATAWSATGSGGKFETAKLGIDPGFGIGVCNRNEGAMCSPSNQALDNNGADDLILFRFSRTVSLNSLKLQQFGGDSDLSLWAGTGPVSLNGMTASALGTAALINNTITAKTTRTIDLANALNGSYDWLAVAARIGQENDFAKLRALTVQPVTSPVPEASTSAMLLAGLGLTGLMVRRRM